MLKRLLETSPILATLAATTALAWHPYTIVNGTNDKGFYVTRVTFTEAAGNVSSHPLWVGPQRSAQFTTGELPGCDVAVVLTQEWGPQIRATNLFNACSQTTITVTILPNGQWSFTYN